MDDPTEIYTEIQNKQIEKDKIQLTEYGLAESFAKYFGENVRFDHKRNRFLIWSGSFWEEDTDGGIERKMKHLSDILMEEGKTEKNKDLMSWAVRMQTNAKFNNIKNLIKTIKPIAITGEEFDTKPMLLGVKNGVVDLSTGLLRDGQRNDYVSMFSPVEFDPVAISGIWEQFIETTFEGDMELIHYIQMALGYSLTGDMGEQVIFICYGEGENGKSIFFSVINKILGDYAKTASSNLFKKNPFNTQTNDVAEIERARFLTNAESIKGAHLDEERIKSISGGDRVTARKLHQNNFSFYPQCKIWLYTNNYPKIDDESYGMKRRLRVIEFAHKITADERIDNYDLVMMNEAPGILNWLVKGCLDWQKEGLKKIPASIDKSTEDYYAENNPLNDYLEDRTEKDEEGEVSTSLLYTDYKLWMAERRKTPETQTRFGRLMNQLPYSRIKKSDANYYVSLKIKNP